MPRQSYELLRSTSRTKYIHLSSPARTSRVYIKMGILSPKPPPLLPSASASEPDKALARSAKDRFVATTFECEADIRRLVSPTSLFYLPTPANPASPPTYTPRSFRTTSRPCSPRQDIGCSTAPAACGGCRATTRRPRRRQPCTRDRSVPPAMSRGPHRQAPTRQEEATASNGIR